MVPAVGIAGYMGSGKSTAARFFAQATGLSCIDGDALAKTIMDSDAQVQAGLSQRFGVVRSGSVDYAGLGKIVFADARAMADLNAIVHPPLIAAINNRLARGDAFLDAALIPLWEGQLTVDYALWISAPVSVRIARTAERDGISAEAAAQRIHGQERTLPEPAPNSLWRIIHNGGSVARLREKIETCVVEVGVQ
ncbi:MAG: dephospho-CoA kinase [Fibrobacterota bacterium]